MCVCVCVGGLVSVGREHNNKMKVIMITDTDVPASVHGTQEGDYTRSKKIPAYAETLQQHQETTAGLTCMVSIAHLTTHTCEIALLHM